MITEPQLRRALAKMTIRIPGSGMIYQFKGGFSTPAHLAKAVYGEASKPATYSESEILSGMARLGYDDQAFRHLIDSIEDHRETS